MLFAVNVWNRSITLNNESALCVLSTRASVPAVLIYTQIHSQQFMQWISSPQNWGLEGLWGFLWWVPSSNSGVSSFAELFFLGGGGGRSTSLWLNQIVSVDITLFLLADAAWGFVAVLGYAYCEKTGKIDQWYIQQHIHVKIFSILFHSE